MKKLEVLKDVDNKLGSLDASVGTLNTKVDNFTDKCENLKVDVDTLRKDYGELRADLDQEKTARKALEVRVANPVSACLRELSERADKQRKLIAFGIPESGESNYKKKIEADRAFVTSLLELLAPDLVGVKFYVSRIGERVEGNVVPRPLRVKFESAEQANLTLKLFIAQKKATVIPPLLLNLSLTGDKTKMQRDEYAQIKAQLEVRKATGEEGLFISTRSGAPVIQSHIAGKKTRVAASTSSSSQQASH